MRLGVAAALVEGQVVPGDVEVEGGVVAAVGASPAGRAGLAVPGLIDVQVNGLAGVDFLTADAAGYQRARQAMAAAGVTAFLPTLVTSPADVCKAALQQVGLAQHAPGPRVLGAHLEGPFLSPSFKGAHDERWLRLPDTAAADELCDAGPVALMTVAPELAGGMDLVRHLVERGVVVSLGHTDADAAQAHAAYDAGARAVTHLFNAQRRFTARDPGVSGVALTRADVSVSLIADFVHLAPETVLAAWLAARHRLVLVTDAVSAAGQPPGAYPLGSREVVVDGHSARLADGTLAGSVLSLDQAVRNLASLGVPLADAVHAATAAPAALLRWPDLGTLHPGAPADMAVLDDGLEVVRTLVGGAEAFAAS
jgi:N-acetylglucosamine-6-phosphate deacetylase